MSGGEASDALRLADLGKGAAKSKLQQTVRSEVQQRASQLVRGEFDKRVDALFRGPDVPAASEAVNQTSKNDQPAGSSPALKPAQTRQVAHVKNWVAVAIEPDLCRIGNCIIAFNSFSILPEAKAGSPDVTACGTRVLRKGDLIKGVKGNAGSNIDTGRSLSEGYLELLEGHKNVTVNCIPVACHDSLCRINTTERGGVGPLARMVTMVKPVGATTGVRSTSAEPPPGKRTSKLLEGLKAKKDEVDDLLMNFDASDEYFDVKKMHANADQGIAILQATPGTVADNGAQILRAVGGIVKDVGLGIVELGYEGVKKIPKTAQSLTPLGMLSDQLEKAILLENIRLGNITLGTVGDKGMAIGEAILKPVTEPMNKGQYWEASTRLVMEVLLLPITWTKAGRAKKAADAAKAAEAAKVAEAAKLAEAARLGEAARMEEAARAADAAKGLTSKTAGVDKTAPQTTTPVTDGVHVKGRDAKVHVALTAHQIEQLSKLDVNGIRAQQILVGDNGKIAVIGRNMGDFSKRGEYGVVDYARVLRNDGYQTELFAGPQIKKEWFTEIERLRQQHGVDILPDNIIHKTEFFSENVAWAKKLVDENYTVIDIGNPSKKPLLGPFYGAEQSTVFNPSTAARTVDLRSLNGYGL